MFYCVLFTHIFEYNVVDNIPAYILLSVYFLERSATNTYPRAFSRMSVSLE